MLNTATEVSFLSFRRSYTVMDFFFQTFASFPLVTTTHTTTIFVLVFVHLLLYLHIGLQLLTIKEWRFLNSLPFGEFNTPP